MVWWCECGKKKYLSRVASDALKGGVKRHQILNNHDIVKQLQYQIEKNES